MKLVIVESPTKAKTLAKYLPSGYKVVATLGHIRDLPKNKLGVDIKKDFAPSYVISKKRQDVVKDLKKQAKKVDKIILATDPDREGEAIAWHTAYLIEKARFKKPDDFFTRITFHEITSDAVKKALQKEGQINTQLVDAQQARRILDRLVGYKLSPLLWKKLKKGLSAGRVQSVAVRLIVDKEKEIEKFKSIDYWEIEALLKKLTGNHPSFIAKLDKINNQIAKIKSQPQADEIESHLKKADYKILPIDRREYKKFPSPPFTTSTLQQTAANSMGWTAKKTMMMAQKLFEEGHITYHRTDSLTLSKEALDKIRQYITSSFNNKYLPDKPNFYKTKSKLAQEAHEAIRPTGFTNLEEQKTNIREKLGRDQARLFSLVFKRTVASQMNPAVYDKMTVQVEAKSKNIYILKSLGSKKIFDGFLKIYGTDYKNDQDQLLPPLKDSEKLALEDENAVKVEKKQTQPPPRYTEASLIKTLEEYGIGRPSTYAPTISTIKDRLYVEVEEKKLKPTFLGIKVNTFLIKYFPDVLDYQFTAQVEEDLDKIAKGEKQWQPVIKQFYTPFEKKLIQTQKKAKKQEVIEKAPKDAKCEKCGAPLVVRYGRFGKFLACSRFPDCKYTKTIVVKTDIKCPDCGGDVIIKRTKKKKSFFGCSNYPKCKFASWSKPKTEEQASTDQGEESKNKEIIKS